MTLTELDSLTSQEQNRIESRVNTAFNQFNGDGETQIFAAGWSSSSLGVDGSEVPQNQLALRPDARFLTHNEIFGFTGQTPDATGRLRWRVAFLSLDESRRGGNARFGWCVYFQALINHTGTLWRAEKKVCGGPAGAGFNDQWAEFPED